MTRHPRSTKAYQAAAAPWSWSEGAVRQNWSVGSKVDGDRAAEVEEADIWMIPAGRVNQHEGVQSGGDRDAALAVHVRRREIRRVLHVPAEVLQGPRPVEQRADLERRPLLRLRRRRTRGGQEARRGGGAPGPPG